LVNNRDRSYNHEEADMKSLEGKVALVAGAASKRGMGHAIALRLAKEGADVAVADKYAAPRSLFAGDEGWGGLDEIVGEIESLGRKALPVAADISSSQDVDKAVAKTRERFGQIDILVNCVGILGTMDTPFTEFAEEDWRRILDVNLTGSFLIARAVAKSMISTGQGGKIVLIASLAANRGVPGNVAYCASKWGIIGLVKTMALELAKYKIYVNAINPGSIVTNIRDADFAKMEKELDITFDEARERDFQKFLPNIPMGRFGTTAEIADLALFLASDQSSYITGEAINISGGIP
jgi:NAD(P)-dependent dehydrogenase (short-subunit alcohol dehydrogenase family)